MAYWFGLDVKPGAALYDPATELAKTYMETFRSPREQNEENEMPFNQAQESKLVKALTDIAKYQKIIAEELTKIAKDGSEAADELSDIRAILQRQSGVEFESLETLNGEKLTIAREKDLEDTNDSERL